MNLKSFRIFAELADQDRRVLADFLERQRVPAGQCLFREGDEAAALVLVTKGRLQVESREAGELGTLGPGDWIGEASLVTVGAREATITALKNSVVLRLERTSMRVLLDEAPRTAASVLEAVAGSLAGTLRRFAEAAAVDRTPPDA